MLLLLLLLALPAAVQAQSSFWPCRYTTENGTITITQYMGSGGAETIPDTINSLPVTTIGPGAFEGCTTLTSITIPPSVTFIEEVAFALCPSLTRVFFQGGPPGYEFQGVFISFPNGPQSPVVDPATAYYLPGTGWGSASRYAEIPASLWDPLSQVAYTTTNGTITITKYLGPGGLLTIPSTIVGLPVTSIGEGAFASSSLTSITIGTNITNIGSEAFQDCQSLTNVTLPNSVTSIGDHTFDSCFSLTSITLLNSVTSIGNYTFQNCTNLSGVYFQGNAPAVGSSVFYGDNHATVYYLPGTTGWGATFGGRPTALWNLGTQFNITANNGTITITKYLGSGGSLTIPSTIAGLPVTSIGDGAFASTSLTSITIGTNITNIGSEAFKDCQSLTSVTVPNSVTSIRDNTFDSCVSLTSVTIPNSVTSIGNYAFDSCVSLTSVGIPNSVTSIGNYTFQNCTNLNGVYFQGNAPTVGSSVFYGDNNATIYYLPRTTGWSATFGGRPTMLNQFNYETNNGTITITRYTGPGGAVTIPDTINGLPVTTIGGYYDQNYNWYGAFAYCRSLTSVTIGTNVTSIVWQAFFGCTSLTNVTIPNSVTSIGYEAFCDCVNLAVVYCTGNAPGADSSVFAYDPATVYYLPGTTGWGATFAGRPAMFWPNSVLPIILAQPLTQTAEMGSPAFFSVGVANTLLEAVYYQWYFFSNPLDSATNSFLALTNVQPAQAGTYTAIVRNQVGAVVSAWALLSVIPPVARTIVPAVQLPGGTGSVLHLEYADRVVAAVPQWLSLTNATLSAGPQFWFELAQPLPAQRYYRGWQANGPSAPLAMSLATEIPLTGTIGSSVRVDYINAIGPTNAWVTLDTVVLTNTTQLYFDTSACRQPQRLYRLVQIP